MAPRTIARLRMPKPLVITIGNLKGGASKTTSAFFLACYFALVHGLNVLVLDADPLSQTGYSWYDTLKQGGIEVPFTLVPFPSKMIDVQIDRYSKDFDVIIVDAGGESDEIFRAAMLKTHELIIATSTSKAELKRIPATYAAAEISAAKVEHEINVRVLITRVPNNMRRNDQGEKVNSSVEYREAIEMLDDADYEVFKTYITAGKWYRAATDGLVGKGAENPILDVGEYRGVGDEIISNYMEEEAA